MFVKENYRVCVINMGRRECGQVMGAAEYYQHCIKEYQELTLIERQTVSSDFYPAVMIDGRLGLIQNNVEA
jgi:hypothetical protein